FGIARDEVAVLLSLPTAALQRHFVWLNGTAVRIRQPHSLKEAWPDKEDPPKEASERRRATDCPRIAVGWCLDSILQPATIHPWLTASVLEFLSDYRDFLQGRVNSAIRARFQSYSPSTLHKLGDVGPTDLWRDYNERVITKIGKAIA